MNNKLILILAILSLIFIIACGNKENIKIGFIGPLSGDAASYGLPMKNVINLAIEEINNVGGVKGRMLEVLYEDGQCNGKEALTAIQKLVNVDDIKVVLGGLCSGETLGAAPIAEASKVILFSAGSGSPDVTKAGDYIFRNFPSDATSGSKVAKVAIQNGHKNIGIIAEQTDYAQAVKNVFKTTLESNGGKVLIDEAFASDSNDFRTQVTKIKSVTPDGVYLVAQTPAKYGLALKQLKELSVDQQIYTNEFASAADTLKDYSKEIEGAIYAEPSFDEKSPKASELLSKMQAKYGSTIGGLPPVYLATAYDATYILKEGIEKCGENTDCVKDYLYSIKNRDGTAGKLTIDQNGDPEFEYIVKTIKEGKPTSN